MRNAPNEKETPSKRCPLRGVPFLFEVYMFGEDHRLRATKLCAPWMDGWTDGRTANRTPKYRNLKAVSTTLMAVKTSTTGTSTHQEST